MAGRRAATGVVVAAVGLTAVGCGLGGTKTVTNSQTVTTTTTVTTTRSTTSAKPCLGTQLKAAFTVVPNSAGAGQIAYALTVKNTSLSTCSVRGIPAGTLLSVTGSPLPTHIRPAGPGGRPQIVLPPGALATAQARFSPDVAGGGDSQSGTCQPQAHALQLDAQGGGVTEAPIRPPTSVCEQGTLNFDAFGYAGSS